MAPIVAPISVTVLGKTNRAVGTYLTATASIVEGVDHLGLTDTMSDTDASDPTNAFTLTVFVSPDGVAWRGVFQESWRGGTHTDKQTGLVVPNHLNIQWANSELESGTWVGWEIRAELTLLTPIRLGLVATVYPAG